ncbi:hypothetical protein PVK06_048179 [Gossypium arboreum]|uniref:Reverse transcriptase domain-containing protein n=1 Tax=Gossypium arboreum TaxID=29729 RepID=A0ABR0MFK1_GOSAR|nr:hypothetical protein PVK06_048179 [Gossypium arboreum]
MNYTKEEIEAMVFEMGPTKAPGDDGLHELFSQKCWPIVGNYVVGFFLHLLNGDMEISNPLNMMHFRSISLCNFLYKILAKAIANRFRVVIGKCIDAAQSAFVPERLISDNVLLAYEILNTLKQKRVGKKGFMAVKLDMSKAYDRVQWDFIKQLGVKFQPCRGLRQGDPLSPFLFLICGEGLSSLMRVAAKEGLLKGVKASRNSPPILHLLFADDCILFGEATRRGAQEVDSLERPNSPDNLQPELVSDLIDGVNRKWKIELINNTFHLEVARKILHIPLSESAHEDFQVWKGEQTGEYSVRSAYKLLQIANLDPSNYLLQTKNKKLFEKLWNQQLPSKITIII